MPHCFGVPLVVFPSGYGYVCEPGHAGVVGEILLVENPEDLFRDFFFEYALHLHVATLKISFSLAAEPRSVRHGDGVSGDSCRG